MRPIDADKLRERLQNLAYDDWNQGITTSFADACNEIIQMVEEQPIIEPESEDATFWEKRAREYEEMAEKLTVEMARGVKIDSVAFTEGGLVVNYKQPEIIRCRECKYFVAEGMYCAQNIIVQYDHFYCYYAERQEE